MYFNNEIKIEIHKMFNLFLYVYSRKQHSP
jgi:hypothetical protein